MFFESLYTCHYFLFRAIPLRKCPIKASATCKAPIFMSWRRSVFNAEVNNCACIFHKAAYFFSDDTRWNSKYLRTSKWRIWPQTEFILPIKIYFYSIDWGIDFVRSVDLYASTGKYNIENVELDFKNCL